jgi:hypothetical protein
MNAFVRRVMLASNASKQKQSVIDRPTQHYAKYKSSKEGKGVQITVTLKLICTDNFPSAPTKQQVSQNI